MDPSSLNMLVGDLQRAAMDDGHWTRWVDAAIAAFGAQGGALFVIDNEEPRIRVQFRELLDIDVPKFEREYAGGIYLLDPALERATASAAPEIFHDVHDEETTDPRGLVFADWRRSWRISPHHLTASFVTGARWRAIFCLIWPHTHGPTRAQEIGRFATLMPHLDGALRFGLGQQAVLQASWWESEGGRSSVDAMALLDDRGFVIRMSPAFEDAMRGGQGLAVARNWLRARDPEADRRLQSALFRAVAGVETATVSIVLPHAPGAFAKLEVRPVARSHRYLVPHEAAALLHLHIPPARRSRRPRTDAR